MFSWRCWSHIQVFQNIRRIFRIFRRASFPIFSKLEITKISRFPNMKDINVVFGFSWTIWTKFVYAKFKTIRFGSHGHVHKSKNHEMMTFRVSPKWNQKVTSFNWSRISLRGFWTTLFSYLTIRMAPQTPQTPNPEFSWIFYRNPSNDMQNTKTIPPMVGRVNPT